MSERHHAIVVPGLGDDVSLMGLYVRSWPQKYGIETHIHNAHWQDKSESYEDKLARLLEEVDDVSREDDIVSLVGVSAGGSHSFNCFNHRKTLVNKAINVCGCLRLREEVRSLRTRSERYPAHMESVRMVLKEGRNLLGGNIRRVMSLTPIYDEIVPVSTAEIMGRNNIRMRSLLHVPSIFIAFNFYSRTMANFILRSNSKIWKQERERYLLEHL